MFDIIQDFVIILLVFSIVEKITEGTIKTQYLYGVFVGCIVMTILRVFGVLYGN